MGSVFCFRASVYGFSPGNAEVETWKDYTGLMLFRLLKLKIDYARFLRSFISLRAEHIGEK
jgi:hypothetical protein